MTLDLTDLTMDWPGADGELSARLVVGRDGSEQLQLRVDLGLMQMFPDGRPDGMLYRGFPSALQFVRHELVTRSLEELIDADWQALERELFQLNYRRLAIASLVEDALSADDCETARTFLRRALRDIAACGKMLDLLSERGPLTTELLAMRPTLLFNRARLEAQLHIIDRKYEEAIEAAKAGLTSLDALLEAAGFDDEQREEDAGIEYLERLIERIRDEYGIDTTLAEQLEEALENEEYELAADLRDELEARTRDAEAEGDGDGAVADDGA